MFYLELNITSYSELDHNLETEEMVACVVGVVGIRVQLRSEGHVGLAPIASFTRPCGRVYHLGQTIRPPEQHTCPLKVPTRCYLTVRIAAGCFSQAEILSPTSTLFCGSQL